MISQAVTWLVAACVLVSCSLSTAEDCDCVPFYLCDANNVIITDGTGLLDFRSGFLEDSKRCEVAEEVCCKSAVSPDNNKTGLPTDSLDHNPETAPDQTNPAADPNPPNSAENTLDQTNTPADSNTSVNQEKTPDQTNTGADANLPLGDVIARLPESDQERVKAAILNAKKYHREGRPILSLIECLKAKALLLKCWFLRSIGRIRS